MKCPLCDATNTRVYNSRSGTDGEGELAEPVVHRYRECSACGTRWRTREAFEHLLRVDGKSTRPDRIRDGSLPCFGRDLSELPRESG